MSQTTETGGVLDGDTASTVIIPVETPLYQANGTNLYKLNLETTARQVKMSDGVDAETRITTLERALAANTSSHIVDTIAERDALKNLVVGDKVTVLDATADDTVEAGGATYLYMKDFSFRKLAEDESMDVVCNWEHLQGKPASDVDDIDHAVLKQHVHRNRQLLDLLSDDQSGADAGVTGRLLYDGKPVSDGRRDVVTVAALPGPDGIPPSLREGGLLIVNPALAPAE